MRFSQAAFAIALFLAGGAVAFSTGENPAPKPPNALSELGYLELDADLVLPPAKEQATVLPLRRLIIADETDEAYFFILSSSEGSSLCRMPKIMKYVLQLRIDENGETADLRAPLGLELLPLKLDAGSELPLVSINEKNYIALNAARNGLRYNVAIPKGAPGVKLAKESRFEAFSKAQTAKGLALYKGEWMPREKALELEKAGREAEALRDARFERLKEMALTGHIVFKDMSVADGKYRGSDGVKLLFEFSNGSSRWLAPDEIADIDLKQAAAAGFLKDARTALKKAQSLFDAGKLGEAAKAADDAKPVVDKIPEGASFQGDSQATAARDLESLESAIAKKLSDDGLELYRFIPFKKEELKAHLALGHMLLRDAIWLKPSQVCSTCKGSGQANCPACAGLGQLRVVCAVCAGTGQTTCPVCDGNGFKRCPGCGGNGFITRICRQCSGSGYVWTSASFPPRGPTVAITGGVSIVSIPPPIWSYGDIQARCSRCDGTGYEKFGCQLCAGRGMLPCPKTVSCEICKGRGFFSSVCKTCSGKGKVDCPDCGGKGYSGNPQGTEPEAKGLDCHGPPLDGAGPSQQRAAPL